MNPRAAINDLHPFQGCPFSHLGYFSTCAKSHKKIQAQQPEPQELRYNSCRPLTMITAFSYYIKYKISAKKYLQRRGWDSNPRALADKRFSRPPRYDHFDTSPGSHALYRLTSAKNILSKKNMCVNNFFILDFPISISIRHFYTPDCPSERNASAIRRSSDVVILIFA